MKLSNLTFIAVALCAGTVAKADEVLKFRAVMHATFIQSHEVGDVDGHTLGLAHYSGLASFSDGSVGTINFTATTDYTKGSGVAPVVYSNVTLKDGSVLWYKQTNNQTRLEGTISKFLEAPLTVLHGTGRFEGAKGDGTSIGARLTPLAVGAELYTDVVINVKK